MKKQKRLFVLGMLVLSTALLVANEDVLQDRGGKYGTPIKVYEENPPLEIPLEQMNTNRSSCYSYIWTSARLKVRDWDYWIGGKVKGYGYTTTNYGNSSRSCNIPFKSKSMQIKLHLARYGYLANSTGSNRSSYSTSGSYYWISSPPGQYINSYHTTNLGWTTVQQRIRLSR